MNIIQEEIMSKKYLILIPTVLLLAACSPEEGENNEEAGGEAIVEEVESAEEVPEFNEWQVAHSDETWNGATITIKEGTLLLERKLPESSLTVVTTYNLTDEADHYTTQNVSKIEILVPHDENGEVLQEEAAPFQNKYFESEEIEEGTLFVAENPDVFEEYAYLAPRALDIYDKENNQIEVVAFGENPAIVLGVSPDENFEENQNISALYDSLNQSLLEISTQEIENARSYLDEILTLTPDSQVATHHENLINHAAQYLQAFNNADGEGMESEIAELERSSYANLYGVYDTYIGFHETISPYMEQVSAVDSQLAQASTYFDNEQYTEAEALISQVGNISDILTTYFPSKAENLAALQTRLQETQTQNQVAFEDFLGYWGDVEAPYASISPGQEMLYISHNYYASFVMNSDIGFFGQIQGSSIDGNTLYLDVFSKGIEPDMMYPEGIPDVYQTVALTMHQEGDSNFIVIDADGHMFLYYPVDSGEAIEYLGGTGLEESLSMMYQ